jgi:hypothetical protein
LELLKLYARQVPEKDLLEIRRLLAQYFMDKASDLADQVWDEKGLAEEDLLQRHQRSFADIIGLVRRVDPGD